MAEPVHGNATHTPGALEALNRERILSALPMKLQRCIQKLEILQETDSTNDDILHAPAGERHGWVLLAELQKAGKGQKGRRWHSPSSGNIYLSFGWRFGQPPVAFSLLVGVCVCKALHRFGLEGHGIKWPNDIQVNGRKLAGILVESKKVREGGFDVVTGIGINVALGTDAHATVDQPWTDLASELGPRASRRNLLVALLLDELLHMLIGAWGKLEDALAISWSHWDLLIGKTVRVIRDQESFEGEALGISKKGALRIASDHGKGPAGAERQVVEFNTGEASVRYA